MSDVPVENDKIAEDTVAAKKTAAQKAEEALREAQAARSDAQDARAEMNSAMSNMRNEFMLGFATIKDALSEALAAKSSVSDDASPKRKVEVKGRTISDDEISAFVDRLSSDDAARMHELIAAKAENELWAERGINPATHVIATEALKLMYDRKPIFTVPGQDYERAKLDPKDLLQYGETHFTAPRLKK